MAWVIVPLLCALVPELRANESPYPLWCSRPDDRETYSGLPQEPFLPQAPTWGITYRRNFLDFPLHTTVRFPPCVGHFAIGR
ncbi:hypothetical protein N7510_008516 [Penicillium lagena]|uniref:uncharacterized protein n=1 Tax=Penicillium lagena TaxID=94218 RepID=UPI002540F98E|nr:uncharacterized protein N7510_008516 [Penicillium lagena]KAJ5605735.1 hypothetical protein N7510_008516 [Penicillium lagena]